MTKENRPKHSYILKPNHSIFTVCSWAISPNYGQMQNFIFEKVESWNLWNSINVTPPPSPFWNISKNLCFAVPQKCFCPFLSSSPLSSSQCQRSPLHGSFLSTWPRKERKTHVVKWNRQAVCLVTLARSFNSHRKTNNTNETYSNTIYRCNA